MGGVCVNRIGTERTIAGPMNRTLFAMTEQGADELVRIVSETRRLQQTDNIISRFLDRFDEEDWQRLRQQLVTGAPRPPPELARRPDAVFLFRHYLEGASPELIRTLRDQVERSASYEAFIRSVRELQEEAGSRAAPRPTVSISVETFAGSSTEIPDYAKNLAIRIGETKVLHLKERRNPIGPEEAAQLLSLKVKRGGPEILNGIQQTVSALLGVTVDAFAGSTASSSPQPRAELDIDNFLIEVNGSGIREALRLVLDAEFNDPDLLLVEEPEIHLHPALEMSMMRYLKRMSATRQVFITTHSTNFLDTVEPHNVYLVSKNDATTAAKLTFEDAEQRIPEELGLRLSSLFMYDRVLFVEGPSDEAVIREWATIAGINLSLLNVGFIHLKGIGNFTHYAAQEILNFLSRRRVKLWFILDRDERAEAEVTIIKERVGQDAKIVVLNRRELENYLVSPRINRENLLRRRRADGTADFRQAWKMFRPSYRCVLTG